MLSVALVSGNAAGTGPGDGVSDFSTVYDEGASVMSATQNDPQSNLSADGSKLVFVSEATDLVPRLDDINHASDVFVHDTTTGQTTLVSATPGGEPGNGASFDPVISPDGRYVAFMSQATDLSTVAPSEIGLANDMGGYLYVRDLQTGTTTLLDVTPAGQPSDGMSTGQFVFSPNSQELAFIDTSDDLTDAPVESPASGGLMPSSSPDYVYTYNLEAQTTSLVSVSTSGEASGDNTEFSGGATDLVFSPDSRSLVFDSTATDLTDNPPGPPSAVVGGFVTPSANVYLRNLVAGTTSLLSVTTGGQQAAGTSSGAVFSPDGDSVAFISDATGLTDNAAGPNGFAENLYVRDLSAGTTQLVSVTTGGQLSSGYVLTPVFSPDGQSLAFASSATDLSSDPIDPSAAPGYPAESGDSNPPFEGSELYLADLGTGQVTPVTVTPAGQLSNGVATDPVFSPDGRYLAFTSGADDLTANAFEKARDITDLPPIGTGAQGGSGSGGPSVSGAVANVFVRDLTTGTTSLASVTTGGLLPSAVSGNLLFSPDGQSIYFASSALDLTNNPPDTSSDGPTVSFQPNNLFERDLATGTTELISATPAGQLSSADQTAAVLSPDGQTIDFDSDATDLTAGGDWSPTADTYFDPMNVYSAQVPITVPDQLQFQSWETTAPVAGGPVTITVDRTGPSTSPASVDYSVQDGTATAGTDYTATSGTLNFAPGQTSQTFSVPLVAGDTFSGARTATLTLSNAQGAGLGYPTATLDLTGIITPPPVTPVTPSTPTTTVTPTSPVTSLPTFTATTVTPVTSASPTATTPTPVPTPTPVARPTPTPTPAPSPGPQVVSVSAQASRREIASVVVTFNRPLNPATAGNAANYHLSRPGTTRVGRHGLRIAGIPGRPLRIRSASYDAATDQVTLTLVSKLAASQAADLVIDGTNGGLTGVDGVALNSPGASQSGWDAVATIRAAK